MVSDVVWAETAVAFPESTAAAKAIGALGGTFSASILETANAAGLAWRAYRNADDPRTRAVADFLVGAHALVQADRLLTRDRGFYRRYFTSLTVIDPAAG